MGYLEQGRYKRTVQPVRQLKRTISIRSEQAVAQVVWPFFKGPQEILDLVLGGPDFDDIEAIGEIITGKGVNQMVHIGQWDDRYKDTAEADFEQVFGTYVDVVPMFNSLRVKDEVVQVGRGIEKALGDLSPASNMRRKSGEYGNYLNMCLITDSGLEAILNHVNTVLLPMKEPLLASFDQETAAEFSKQVKALQNQHRVFIKMLNTVISDFELTGLEQIHLRSALEDAQYKDQQATGNKSVKNVRANVVWPFDVSYQDIQSVFSETIDPLIVSVLKQSDSQTLNNLAKSQAGSMKPEEATVFENHFRDIFSQLADIEEALVPLQGNNEKFAKLKDIREALYADDHNAQGNAVFDYSERCSHEDIEIAKFIEFVAALPETHWDSIFNPLQQLDQTSLARAVPKLQKMIKTLPQWASVSKSNFEMANTAFKKLSDGTYISNNYWDL